MKKRLGWAAVAALFLVSLSYAQPLPLVPGQTQQPEETAGATTQEQTTAPKTAEQTTAPSVEKTQSPATPANESGSVADHLKDYLQDVFSRQDGEESLVWQPDTQEQLLAKVIYGAAADQPYGAKVAVGNVVVNRMQSVGYPDTLSGVVFEEDTPWKEVPDKADEACIRAARDALNGMDLSGGATSFTREQAENATVKLGSITFTA